MSGACHDNSRSYAALWAKNQRLLLKTLFTLFQVACYNEGSDSRALKFEYNQTCDEIGNRRASSEHASYSNTLP